MKFISKKIISLFWVLLILNQDLVITVQKASETKNVLAERLDRNSRKKHENSKALNKGKTKLVFLAFLAIAVGLIVLDMALQGAANHIKNKIDTEEQAIKNEKIMFQIQQNNERIKQNHVFISYCNSFEKVGQMVTHYASVARFQQMELKANQEELKKTLKTTPASSLAQDKPLEADIREMAVAIDSADIGTNSDFTGLIDNQESQLKKLFYQNCYNAYKRRNPSTIGRVLETIETSEEDFDKMLSVVEEERKAMQKAAKNAGVAVKDYAKATWAGIFDDNMKLESVLTTLEGLKNPEDPTEYKFFSSEQFSNFQVFGVVSTYATKVNAFLGNIKEIAEVGEAEHLSKARKNFKCVIGSLEALDNLISVANSVSTVTGHSANIPFTGAVINMLKTVDLGLDYKQANNLYKEETDLGMKEVLKHRRDMQFWNVMDGVADTLKEISTSILTISALFATLTAGASMLIALAIKPLFTAASIFTSYMKLRKMRSLHKTYTTLFTGELLSTTKATEKMKADLEKERCSLFSFILREFLAKEFEQLSKSSEESKKLTNELATQVVGAMTNEEKQKVLSAISNKNAQMMKIMCQSSKTGCLEFMTYLKTYKLDLVSVPDLTSVARSAASEVIMGPINSAFLVQHSDPAAFKLQTSLLANGYVPAFQDSLHDLFICRGCLDSSNQVSEFAFYVSNANIPGEDSAKDIQDTVMGEDHQLSGETTVYFVAKMKKVTAKAKPVLTEVIGNTLPGLREKDYSPQFSDSVKLAIFEDSRSVYDAVMKNIENAVLSVANSNKIAVVYTEGEYGPNACKGLEKSQCATHDLERTEARTHVSFKQYSIFIEDTLDQRQNFFEGTLWKKQLEVADGSKKFIVYQKELFNLYWMDPELREGQDYAYYSDGPIEKKSKLKSFNGETLSSYIQEYSTRKSKDIVNYLFGFVCDTCYSVHNRKNGMFAFETVPNMCDFNLQPNFKNYLEKKVQNAFAVKHCDPAFPDAATSICEKATSIWNEILVPSKTHVTGKFDCSAPTTPCH